MPIKFKELLFQLMVVLLSCDAIFGSNVRIWRHLEKRKAGEQPPAGECMNCRWGGQTGVHFYTCCNNCDEPDNECDGVEYDSASNGDYCGKCGVDSADGDGTCNKGEGDTFQCGGCDGQTKIKTKCDSVWLYRVPGFCWAWQMCFNKLCKKVHGRRPGKRSTGKIESIVKRQTADIRDDFCGDGVCNLDETTTNCPMDCCGLLNPVCIWETYFALCFPDGSCDKCPPLCCSEPTCCGSTINNTTQAGIIEQEEMTGHVTTMETKNLTDSGTRTKPGGITEQVTTMETNNLTEPVTGTEPGGITEQVITMETKNLTEHVTRTEPGGITGQVTTMETKNLTEPVTSTEPSEITEQVTTMETKNLTEPVTGTQPGGITEQVTTMETKNLTEPVTGTEQGGISEQVTTMETKNLTEPVTSTEPGEITEQVTTMETKNLTEPVTGTEPGGITEQVTTMETKNLTEPVTGTQPGGITEQVTTMGTKNLTEPVTGTEQGGISEQVTTMETKNLTEPVTSTEPGEITEQVTTMETKNLTEPVTGTEPGGITERVTTMETKNLTEPVTSTEPGEITEQVATMETKNLTEPVTGTEPGGITEQVTTMETKNLTEPVTGTEPGGITEQVTTIESNNLTDSGTRTEPGGITIQVTTAEPMNLTDSDTRTEPGGITEQVTTIEPKNLTDSGTRTKPSGITEQVTTIEPKNLTESGTRTEPGGITEPVTTIEPKNLTDSDTRTEPGGITEQVTTIEPKNLTDSGTRTKPDRITEPVTTTDPMTLTDSGTRTEPGGITEPVTTIEPKNLTDSGTRTKPDGITESITTLEPNNLTGSGTRTKPGRITIQTTTIKAHRSTDSVTGKKLGGSTGPVDITESVTTNGPDRQIETSTVREPVGITKQDLTSEQDHTIAQLTTDKLVTTTIQAGACEYNGKIRKDGKTFKHIDACNKCECSEGRVQCSDKKRCSSCKYERKRHKTGEYFLSKDKCKKCICIAGSKKAKCENIPCEPTTCTYGDKQYKKGKQWLSIDKCNKCKCKETVSGLSAVCSDNKWCRMCVYKNRKYNVGDVFKETECRSCECQIKNKTACTPICDYCKANDRRYLSGEQWRHPDKCNTCRCKEGLVKCSNLGKCMKCLVGGITYKFGEDFLLDGCVECKCVSTNRLDCWNRCTGKPPANATCGVRPDIGQSRITGGTVVDPAFSWPWMVTIKARLNDDDDLRHVCGGAVINRNWVITASHCFTNKKIGRNPDDFILFFGKHHRTEIEPGEMSREVELIITHEEFDLASNLDSDVALIKLKEPLNYTTHIQPLCLGKTNATFCVMAGWGSTERGLITKDIFFKVELSTYLHQVIVPLIDTSICNREDWMEGRISNNMICAGFEKGGKDACMGDSGGPMFCADNLNQWTLKGIASWGLGCGIPKRPGVYTKVENFLDWIDEKIQIHG
ncbi:unnamed protein product [Owenia fusiformis]|uniref:Uncharacterized protein n=1 Tax=Owenia fusiformis TaxID=6347 RepID=A0A8J1UB99_OWEFU|nr:unnamed protein product [Owenia fusiformis]